MDGVICELVGLPCGPEYQRSMCREGRSHPQHDISGPARSVPGSSIGSDNKAATTLTGRRDGPRVQVVCTLSQTASVSGPPDLSVATQRGLRAIGSRRVLAAADLIEYRDDFLFLWLESTRLGQSDRS